MVTVQNEKNALFRTHDDDVSNIVEMGVLKEKLEEAKNHQTTIHEEKGRNKSISLTCVAGVELQ